MGPETVCLVHMEPVQNAGGAFTPPAGYWKGVREICDRYDILLSADEVITAFGRVGHWFGSERYDIRPDIVCSAKGLSSSYAAIGAVITTDRVMEPFLDSTSMYTHGITFGGHPVMAASTGSGRTRTRSGRRSHSCSTCRSSATCAGRATSTRSSS
jgi:adenosylmethionine-8-amino-7-oxononanoate aminotransferase